MFPDGIPMSVCWSDDERKTWTTRYKNVIWRSRQFEVDSLVASSRLFR